MVTEEEKVKRREEFLLRFGGAMLGGLEDTAFEVYFNWTPEARGKFPYMRPHENLPPYDDLIVGGLAVPPWVIGALMEDDGKKRADTKARELGKNVKMFGEGDATYAFNMLVHRTVQQTAKISGPTGRIVARRSPAAQSRRRTDVGHRITKL